ncbi:hypothetical protein B0H16DRAFT_1328501 [Mycena metata]|uniref:Uncharacterized protein n=1 Tax=Mycena metata TaxID=1033252 RepID=A0AAD7I308_9AGAR|nr:hypothetical protein B0H16DRAFT_1328501 [Mycena metata]
MPSNAPAWLRGCVGVLQTEDLGCHFTALVAALVKLESVYGFDDTKYGAAIPAEHRPTEVTQWIRGGRDRTKKVPKIGNLVKYVKVWQTWWNSLQPEWRRRDGEGNLMAGGEVGYGAADAWGVLDTGGPNGWLSVVASLYFWGVCSGQSVEMKGRWDAAVQDVMWMLEGLTAAF